VVTFAMSFESRAPAEVARSTLETQGFTVDVQPQADHGVVLVATPKADPASPEAPLARIQSLADDLGGELLGHGGVASYGME
jgi:hypothetical protein